MVKNPDKVEVILTSIVMCKPYHRNEKCNGAPMAGKSALPWHEYLPESLPTAKIIIRLIEDTVSETGADYRADKKSVQKRIKKVSRNFLSIEKPLENKPSKDES